MSKFFARALRRSHDSIVLSLRDDTDGIHFRVNPEMVWGIIEAKDPEEAMDRLLAYCEENKLWY